MADQDFEFYAGGIEDGIITALKNTMTTMGVKTFATYSGDMDTENLKKQLASFTAAFPRVMVSYATGVDIPDPPTPRVGGRPTQLRHECNFAVIVATNDARGETARRRGAPNTLGAYAMIAKVRETLSGLTIRKVVNEGEENEETVTLTISPLMPMSNQYIMRIPNVTAYAIIFGTYWRWKTVDRTTEGLPVSELVLDVQSMNSLVENPGNLPGVEVR